MVAERIVYGGSGPKNRLLAPGGGQALGSTLNSRGCVRTLWLSTPLWFFRS